MNAHNRLLLVLAAPIVFLAVLVGHKQYLLSAGDEVVLPITGRDPRDLLAGHYVIYTIDYGTDGVCQATARRDREKGYICAEPRAFHYERPANCAVVIEGMCHGGRFRAGIERYYVAEDKARTLEQLIQASSASLVISVPKRGAAKVKDIWINGAPWQSQ